ncbi:MAG: hypothetical protein ACOCV2_06175 [Persicimonas sp.]
MRHLRLHITYLVVALAIIAPVRAAADDADAVHGDDSSVVDTSDEEELPDDFEAGAMPTAVAVFPGLLLHGAGLYVAGDKKGAYALAAAEGIGLLGTTVGLLSVYGTGASRRIINPIYYGSLVSASALILSWFADIYGASTGGRSDQARRRLPPLEARAGYAYIHDPHFDYAHFGHARAAFRLEPIRFTPEAWIALDDDNQRLRLESDARFYGPRAAPADAAADGTFVDLETGLTYHNFGSEDFRYLVVEAGLGSRYDLRRISPALRGSFTELSLGIGTQMHGYGGEETQLGEDFSSLLLMRTAFGLYFDPPGTPYGELELYYDHRHDDFAAGSSFNTTLDGVMGHGGLEGFYYPGRHWGLFADLQAGSAYLALAGFTFRYGGKR